MTTNATYIMKSSQTSLDLHVRETEARCATRLLAQALERNVTLKWDKNALRMRTLYEGIQEPMQSYVCSWNGIVDVLKKEKNVTKKELIIAPSVAAFECHSEGIQGPTTMGSSVPEAS
jgi:hypothetical protein